MKRIISGPNAVEEALKTESSQIEAVYLLSGLSQKTAARIYHLCERKKVATLAVSLDQLNAMAPNLHHQGVIGIAGEYAYTPLEELLSSCALKNGSRLVVLDQVQDPGNLGAIVRTALCFGAAGVIITRDRSAAMTGGAVRASAGASERLPVSRVVNLATTLQQLKEAGFTVFGATLLTDRPLRQMDWPTRSALVLGNEHRGLRQRTQEHCDHLFTIPMQSSFDSLNVSAAAAIVLYEVAMGQQRIDE